MMRQLLRQGAGAMRTSVATAALEQPDLLDPEQLLPVAAGHSGFPEATDSLAYEPVQRLLAVRAPFLLKRSSAAKPFIILTLAVFPSCNTLAIHTIANWNMQKGTDPPQGRYYNINNRVTGGAL